MNKLLLATAAMALICAGPAFAQDISNSPNSAASGSNSAANSGSTSNASNGGIYAPIDASSRTTSTSDSAANSGSLSYSTSQGGAGGDGGSAASQATAAGGTANAQTGASTSNASNAASNAGNSQNITFNSTVPDHQTVKTVPQVYAPALTTTLTETCMGSTTAGGSGVGFGVTLGTTWNDEQCVRRLNARELAQTLGDRDAARALMCQDKNVAAAYLAVGKSCFVKEVAVLAAPIAAAAPPAPENPPPPVAAPAVTMKPIPNPGERGSYDGERGH